MGIDTGSFESRTGQIRKTLAASHPDIMPIRTFHKYLITTAISLTIILFLTNCEIGCPACISYIDNKTNRDIYVFLETNNEIDLKAISNFVNESDIKEFKLDTIKKTGTFVIPAFKKLLTYSGPGLEPTCNLKYLKITTSDKVIELKNAKDIKNSFEKTGAIFTMTIE